MTVRQRMMSALIASLAAAGLAIALAATPTASASTYLYSGFCYGDPGTADSGQCMDLYKQRDQNYAEIDHWARDISGDTAQQWDFHLLGNVSASAEWPFTPGSGMNSYFNGDPVVTLRWHGDQGMCAGGAIPGTAIYLIPCTGYYGVNWVLAGYSIVNVYSSDSGGSPEYMTASAGGSGDTICVKGMWKAYYSQWTRLDFYY